MTTFYILLAINIFAFLLMGYDKKLAKRKKSRISEKTLLMSAFLGGSLGSGIGMLYFRHKTSKNSYLVKFWSIVIVQIILLYIGYDFIMK
ncbi:DUF1294 domain-containing protein [Flavobacterium tegetincola]|uniref:DUF1294 domain-containing protein n=1 Tax=Flavobacterium tegetincola TaxID=150172 RepID=UPI00040A9FDB|nr:DUF1294 domain-containing protein [Flavobacterium tegetincola]